MYILLSGNKAAEMIPDFNPVFPNVPTEKRYSAEFLARCVYVSDDTEVETGWEYDGERFIKKESDEYEETVL